MNSFNQKLIDQVVAEYQTEGGPGKVTRWIERQIRLLQYSENVGTIPTFIRFLCKLGRKISGIVDVLFDAIARLSQFFNAYAQIVEMAGKW